MAIGVVCSNTIFVETNQRFRMVCPIPPTRCLQSFLRTPGVLLAPTTIKVTVIEVEQRKATKEPENSVMAGDYS